MNVSCPYCAGLLTNSPAVAGLSVTCPHCRRPFTMPPMEEPPLAFKSPSVSRYSRKPKDNTLLYIGGGLLAIFCIAAAVLLVDELRFWNAKRHMKEELKEIDRQFQKADREIKKAADDFERAMRDIE